MGRVCLCDFLYDRNPYFTQIFLSHDIKKNSHTTITGEPDWCSGTQDGKPRENWCVCEWAYEKFLQADEKNCDFLEIDCEAFGNRSL